MKTKKISQLLAAVVLTLSSLMTISLGAVSATGTTLYWCSPGSSSDFNTASNWNTESSCSGGTQEVPANGDSLVFDVTNISSSNVDPNSSDATYDDWVLNNDISGLSLGGITFQGSNSNGYAYALTGDPITLTGSVSATSPYNLINLPVSLGGDVTINSEDYLEFGSSGTSDTFNLGSYSLALTGGASYFYDALAGSGAITISSGGALLLYTDANSYTGAVSVTDGVLTVGSANALGSTSGVTVSGTGSLNLQFDGANTTFDFPLSLGGSGYSTEQYGTLNANPPGISDSTWTATLSGPVTLTSNVTYGGTFSTNITGTYTSDGYAFTTLAGSQGTITTPNGTVGAQAQTITVAAGDNQPDVAVNIGYNQTYIINGERGYTVVENGGVLEGTGQVSGLDVEQGGIASPGDAPGCLTVNGNLNEGGTYTAEIGGTTACSGYDQLIVTSGNTVTLDDGQSPPHQGILQVSLINGFVPKAGETFEIINNEGNQPVSDTFSGLPEGSEITVSGVVFKITYKGGSGGNSVVLTVVKVPKTPDTGSALTKAYVALPLLGSVLLGSGLYLGSKRNLKLPIKLH